MKPYPLENKPTSRCRKWKLIASVGRDPKTGKYKQKNKTFTGSYSDAVEALKAFERDVKERKVTTTSTTFKAFREQWSKDRKALAGKDIPDDKRIAASTVDKDDGLLKCASLHLDHYKMKDITPAVLEHMYTALRSGESPSGKKLSGTYTQMVAVCLHRMFKDAVKEGCMAYNPCDLAEVPKRDTEEKKALRIGEMKELIERLNPTDPPQLVILLAIKLGLRRGEAHALTWGDVDGNVLHVHRAVDRNGNVGKTKTKKSKRDLPLTESVKSDLQKRRSQQEKEFKDTGLKIDADTPIICNKFGERYIPNVSTHWWINHRDALGFTGWTIHEMRHSYLSEMARRGTDVKVLQELAGHANYSTTMNIYTHVTLEDKKQAIEVVDW